MPASEQEKPAPIELVFADGEVSPPPPRSRRGWLVVLPCTVLATVIAVPAAVGVQPLHWTAGALLPHGSSSPTPTARPTPLKQFADPVLNAAESAPPVPSKSAEQQVPKVAKPWHAGMPQWGVQVYWEDMSTDSESEVRGKARRVSDYLVSLGANSVALSFPLYVDSIDSDSVHTESKTPSPARLKLALDAFKAAGLRITLRPIIDERSLLPQWRGALDPASRQAWFTSYGKLLDQYADLAREEGAATLVVGTELVSLENSSQWSSLLSSLHSRFPGQLTYDTNWDNFVTKDVKLPVDQVDVDAYPPVKAPDSASVSTIVNGWQKWLDRKSTGPMPDTVLAEAGVGAQDGAFDSPGDYYRYGTVNAAVQATWYRAVCTVVQERRMAGVYWWSLNFHDDPRTPPAATSSRLDFAGRPLTEQAIRQCFSSSYAGPGTAGKNG